MQAKSNQSYGKRTDLSMRTVVRMERVSQKLINKGMTYFAEYDLTFNQFKVLEVLYHRGNLTISSITKLIMSTPGNITVVVKNLKRDGWVTATKSPEDSRVSIIAITEKGKDVMGKVFPIHAKNLKQHMEVLSDDELETLYTLLNKVYKAN